MNDFLTGRTQLLRVNGDRCDPGLVLSRIQQKSLLSSILFVNFTKDLLLIMWIPKCILLLTIQTDKLDKSYILTFRKSKAFSISYKNNDKILQRKIDIGGSVNINFSWKTEMATKISKPNWMFRLVRRNITKKFITTKTKKNFLLICIWYI